MSDAAFDKLLVEFLPDKPPRVWSLLVTLFGDLAQDPDGKLSSATLHAIFDAIDIKSDALRVALFRLRKDGWITSSRSGRVSNYALTNWGRGECLAANPRIYGVPCATDPAYLVAANPAESLDQKGLGLFQISSNLFVTRNHVSSDSALVVELNRNTPLPNWMSERLCPPALAQSSSAFRDRLVTLEGNLAACKITSPVQIALLRGLVVHDWRRIVLKVPDINEFVFSSMWKGAECRTRVHRMLSDLGKPVSNRLNESVGSS